MEERKGGRILFSFFFIYMSSFASFFLSFFLAEEEYLSFSLDEGEREGGWWMDKRERGREKRPLLIAGEGGGRRRRGERGGPSPKIPLLSFSLPWKLWMTITSLYFLLRDEVHPCHGFKPTTIHLTSILPVPKCACMLLVACSKNATYATPPPYSGRFFRSRSNR